jgi:hypothetical protein
VHAENAAPSRLHSKLEPLSEELKEKSAVVRAAGSGGELVIVVSGATVSTVKVFDAGDGSKLPAGSVARTLIVCWPLARPV